MGGSRKRSLEDAVTLKTKEDDMKILTNNTVSLEEYLTINSRNSPFNDRIVGFISAFTKNILSNKELRQYPDIISLAFWMRDKNIQDLKMQFFDRYPNRVACGTACHFAPSNVDTIFIYSLFISLLLGNKNVVRVSFKNSEEKNILIDEVNNTIQNGFEDILNYLIIVTYPHNENITRGISKKSDLRVIWGGDNAVKEISRIQLPTTSNEIKFANKYSLAVVKASEIALLKKNACRDLAAKLANDIYWFGQQGCSSPKTILWYNDIKDTDLEQVKNCFYQELVEVAKSKFIHEIQDSDYINKIVACDEMAVKVKEGRIIESAGLLTRFVVDDDNGHNFIRSLNCGSGLILEMDIKDLNVLTRLMDRTTQTITYFGFDKNEISCVFDQNNIYPDRLVPIGKALEFSTIWDGYDLLVSMTRGVFYE